MESSVKDRNAKSDSRQIRVRFVTMLPPPLRVPKTAIVIPADFTRMGLSQIVNNLLKEVDSEHEMRPFDFLVQEELIRGPLEQFLLAKGITAEKVLEIEYTSAVAPQKQDPCLHDDWVSAVDGHDPSFIVTGCYDSLARIWKNGTSCTHILEGHNGPISSVHIVNSIGSENEIIHLATGSKDRSLRLWKLGAAENVNSPMKLGAYKILRGHTSAIKSISSKPSGDMICSGSWDCLVNIWDLKSSSAGEDSLSIKKRKVDMDSSQMEAPVSSTLVGHTGCVSSVVWPEDKSIYSASWDHSIRKWDVETGKDVWNMASGKVLHCLDVGGESSSMIAAGSSDSILRIWDLRKPGRLAPVFKFFSHSSWISACKWHRRSWFHLLSASYDGKLMLWDLRTQASLAIIDSHTDKALCADWWKDDSLISGGADSKLCISSGVFIR